MTRIAELQDRLHRLAKRREDEGIYTDANLVEAASARIAELEAEVERLTKDAESYRDIAARKSNQVAGMIRAEALSRTGAVKKAQASIEARIADNEAFQEKHRATWTPENAAYSRGIRDGLSGAAAILDIALSALEPAAPEGQQSETLTYGQRLIAEAIEHHFGERGCNFDEYDGDTTVDDVWDAFDDLTRPSEQAVTEALRDLLEHVDRNTCIHEETHRGGSIWTICDSCGQKWADDRGGFIAYSDPAPVANARAALSAALARKEGRP